MPKRRKSDLSQKSRKSRKQENFRLRSEETEEQRGLRLAKQRERRNNETPDQRAERLSKQRHRMARLRKSKFRVKTSLKSGQEENMKSEEIVKIENDSDHSDDNNSAAAVEPHSLQNSEHLNHIKDEWSSLDLDHS